MWWTFWSIGSGRQGIDNMYRALQMSVAFRESCQEFDENLIKTLKNRANIQKSYNSLNQIFMKFNIIR